MISLRDVQHQYHISKYICIHQQSLEPYSTDLKFWRSGAEVCEVVGTYMLNLLSKKYNKNNFGLYRDDGLAVLKNKSGPQSEQVKKNIQKIFKKYGLDITIQCNLKIVNYLDVIFNLNDRT